MFVLCCRKIILDMLPVAGTAESAYVIKMAIERNELTVDEVPMAFTSLALHALPELCLIRHMMVMKFTNIIIVK